MDDDKKSSDGMAMRNKEKDGKKDMNDDKDGKMKGRRGKKMMKMDLEDMKQLNCTDDLIIVGYEDSKCKDYSWDLHVGNKDKQCRPFKFFKEKNETIYYATQCAKNRGVEGWLYQDQRCNMIGRNKNKSELYYNYTFNKDNECGKTWCPMEGKWIYYNFARNNSNYQKWKMYEMKEKKDENMRWKKIKNANMSSDMSVTVNGYKVSGNMMNGNGTM